jgi:hypothetical protein
MCPHLTPVILVFAIRSLDMDCPPVTSLEQAMAELPSSVLPIKGLRRDSDGNLTPDALQTIMDGLKSRAIDPTQGKEKGRILKDLVSLLCQVKRQYDYLIDELGRRVDAGRPIQTEFVDVIRQKNLFLQDILNVARYMDTLKPFDESSTFIEGWQGMLPTPPAANPMPPTVKKLMEQFQSDRQMLDSKSYVEMRKHRVELLKEKNKAATNYLGIYGFMNLVAVGLLIYIAASD